MDGFERITGREHDGLVEKCQENGWLKVGGFDWQDDPFLEEYPYEFSRTDSVDKLRAASVEHHIIPGEGRDWLLFKVEDAPEVDEAFRQLEQETGKAAERARERLSEIAERRQAPERLAERAERAREASRAHSQGPGRDRGPRQIEGPER